MFCMENLFSIDRYSWGKEISIQLIRNTFNFVFYIHSLFNAINTVLFQQTVAGTNRMMPFSAKHVGRANVLNIDINLKLIES